MTISIKNVKIKIIKIRTGCQYASYLHYSENLNRAAQNLRLGRGLDIAALEQGFSNVFVVRPISKKVFLCDPV